jgi:hypothetical protein
MVLNARHCRRRRRRCRAGAAALAASFLALAAGCALVELLGVGGGPKRFRHDLHAAQGIECASCHTTYAGAEDAGMPSYGVCLACHGPGPDRDPYPYERELQSHAPEEVFASSGAAADLAFSHARHHAEDVACDACHGAVSESSALSEDARSPSPEGCTDCHRERGVNADCSVCHETLARDKAPPSHEDPRGAWMRLHGAESRSPGRGHVENCELCHARRDCDGCHHVEKPQDHSEFFRRRAHGLQVGFDRERCDTCHEESFCVRCHRQTRPMSHVAGFGGSTSNHCLSCHEPLGGASCSVCHRGAPNHLAATPIPPPPHPNATSDCRLCHLRPPHADDGLDCTRCHR